MNGRPQRWEIVRHIAGVLACLALGWFGIVEGLRIPILADATYGFHEFGHLMAWALPETYRAMMGSLSQVLIPLGLAGYFLLFHRDYLGVSLMLAWTGVSAHETGRYMGDAIAQTMQISPYHEIHDWAFALGELGKVPAADELAWIMQAAGLVCVFVAMGVAALGGMHGMFEYEHVEQVESYLERRPAQQRDGYEEWVRNGSASSPAPERMP